MTFMRLIRLLNTPLSLSIFERSTSMPVIFTLASGFVSLTAGLRFFLFLVCDFFKRPSHYSMIDAGLPMI
jgi:hypothetical protein